MKAKNILRVLLAVVIILNMFLFVGCGSIGEEDDSITIC